MGSAAAEHRCVIGVLSGLGARAAAVAPLSSNMQVTHRCIPDFRDIAQNPTCLPYTPLSWVQGVEMWTPKKLNSFWIGCHFKNICSCWGQKWGNWVWFIKINFTVIQLCFNEENTFLKFNLWFFSKRIVIVNFDPIYDQQTNNVTFLHKYIKSRFEVYS